MDAVDVTLRVVSTHASAREATFGLRGGHRGAKVSTHASAREATFLDGAGRPVERGFNPRLRAGGDLEAAG